MGFFFTPSVCDSNTLYKLTGEKGEIGDKGEIGPIGRLGMKGDRGFKGE